MFAYLEGVFKKIGDDAYCVVVNGVGYALFVPETYALKLADGDHCSFYVMTLVRENAIDLYGFQTLLEKKWFFDLISVQGVGGKLALAILSSLTCNQLYEAITLKRGDVLESVSGVGKKMAERMVRELSDRVAKTMVDAPQQGASALKADVLLSLEQLGYKYHQVSSIVDLVISEAPDESMEQVLVKVLKQIGGK